MSSEFADLDIAVLTSRLLHVAHSVDQRLTADIEDRQTILANHGKLLEEALSEWSRRGMEDNSQVRWAREILAELKGQAAGPGQAASAPAGGDILALIHSRRSIRSWSERDVEPDLIDKLLDAARWAPSSCNRQAVRLVVLRDAQCKEAVVGLNKRFLVRAPVLILVGVDGRLYPSSELTGGVPYLDAGGAIQNMLLAGHSLGLGCLWALASECVWPTRAKVYFHIKKLLNLPRSFRPVSIVAVGWPEKVPRTPPRHDMSHFVRYDQEGFPENDFKEWRPPQWQLLKRKLKRTIKILLGRKV